MSKTPTVTIGAALAFVACLLMLDVPCALAQANTYQCEGVFRAGYECTKAVDGDTATSAVPDAYGDSVAIIEQYVIPPGASAAKWRFRVLRNNPYITVKAFYWDYSGETWESLYVAPVSPNYVTYMVDIPAPALLTSPLKTKMQVKNAYGMSGEYFEGAIDWIGPTYECEGAFRPGNECDKAVDGDTTDNNYACPNLYGDSVAIIENHAIPPGVCAAKWHIRVLRNNPQIEIRASYWDYVTSMWKEFFNAPYDSLAWPTYVLDIPDSALLTSPLKTKMHVRNATSPMQSGTYNEGVIDWIPCPILDTLYIPPVAFAPGEAIKVPVKVKCVTSTVMGNGTFEWDNADFVLDSLSSIGTACQSWSKEDTIDNTNRTIFFGLFDTAGDSLRNGWDTTIAYLFFRYIGTDALPCYSTTMLNIDTANSSDPVKRLFFADNSNPPVEFVPVVNFNTISISMVGYGPGDVNNSGVVNALDITYLINFLYKHGVAPKPDTCMGDVNASGTVNALDVTYLINRLYKGGPAPLCGCGSTLFAPEKPRISGSVSSIYNDGKTEIELNSDAPLAGLEMTLKAIDGKTVNIKSDIAGFELFSSQTGDQIKLGMFDLTGNSKIGNGTTSILEIDGDVEIVSILGADENANGLAFEIVNGASKDAAVPGTFALRPNHPNPFNPTTEINFALPKACDATLEVYNITGQKVATLVDGTLEAGEHTVQWDSRDQSGVSVASGIYLYRLTAGEFRDTKKMILLK